MDLLIVFLYILLAGSAECRIEPPSTIAGVIVSILIGWFVIPARIIAKIAG